MSIQGLLKGTPNNPRGMVVIVGAILAVVALWYSPEIVSTFASTGKSSDAPPPKSQEVAARQLADRVVKRKSGDPFDSVIGKFEAGEYDKITAAGVEAGVVPNLGDSEPQGFLSRLFAPLRPKNKGLKALRGDKPAQRKVLLRALKSGNPTWEVLQLPVVLSTIQRASAESESLFKMLPPQNVDSRLAVRNFIAGLEYFQGKEIRSLSPREGLQFLQRIDRDVTDSLVREKVGRDIFNVWRNVSLETLLADSGSFEYRENLAPPFVADLIVTSVNLSEEDRKKNRSLRRKPRWKVMVSGFVESKAATQVELLGPGGLKKKASLPGSRENEGRWRPFNFTTTESPYGQFIIRVSDDKGAFLEKFYHFIRIGQRFRNPRGGTYQLPTVDTTERDRPIDKALDRLFLVRGPRVGGPGMESAQQPSMGNYDAPPDSVPF